jgi:hypothetical protein
MAKSTSQRPEKPTGVAEGASRGALVDPADPRNEWVSPKQPERMADRCSQLCPDEILTTCCVHLCLPELRDRDESPQRVAMPRVGRLSNHSLGSRFASHNSEDSDVRMYLALG